ncbi:MAG: NAD(+) synthase [Dehalococcoidia bacterium]|nr:MAG: NAD(+) synthase [Dehalococcoidia bacterium]
MEDLAQKLVSWIREQVAGAGCEGVVFGLSGGLDSSVVAVLCQRAFPDNSLAVLMPCHSTKTDLDDAQLVAQKLAITTVTVSLDEVFDSILKALPKREYDPATKRLAEANLKPRLRMSTLYYFANRLRYLVVGTGNRSEIAVGYCTKYGDSGADILPLGNLLKGQVRELASHLGIPHRIIEKTPSAGLWEDQTDEGEMELSYEELDRYLASGQATEGVRRKVEALARATAHKRATPPIPPF